MNLSELKEVVRKYESGIFYGDRAIQLADQVPVLISLLERSKPYLETLQVLVQTDVVLMERETDAALAKLLKEIGE